MLFVVPETIEDYRLSGTWRFWELDPRTGREEREKGS